MLQLTQLLAPLLMMLAPTTLPLPPTVKECIPPPPAETVMVSSMTCVMSNCATALADCAGDPQCSKGLACIATNSENPGAQVRCMDLYENQKMRKFVDCALSKHACVPPKPPVTETPVASMPMSGAAMAQLTAADVVSKFDANGVFQGTWKVAMGLNPLFDIHDCQIHHFYPLGDAKSDGIAASFAYRISPTTDNADSSNDRSSSGPMAAIAAAKMPGWGPRKTVTISKTATPGTFTRYGGKKLTQDATDEGILYLTLSPEYMNYKDTWYILDYDVSKGGVSHGGKTPNDGNGNGGAGSRYSNNGAAAHAAETGATSRSSSSLSSSSSSSDTYSDSDFILVGYYGHNAAWNGYGGANVYTRSGKRPAGPGVDARLEQALKKVGLSLKDLQAQDNTCPPLQ